MVGIDTPSLDPNCIAVWRTFLPSSAALHCTALYYSLRVYQIRSDQIKSDQIRSSERIRFREPLPRLPHIPASRLRTRPPHLAQDPQPRPCVVQLACIQARHARHALLALPPHGLVPRVQQVTYLQAGQHVLWRPVVCVQERGVPFADAGFAVEEVCGLGFEEGRDLRWEGGERGRGGEDGAEAVDVVVELGVLGDGCMDGEETA